MLYYYSFTYSDEGRPTGSSTFESATLSFTPLQAGVSYQIDVRGAPADAFSIAGGPELVLGSNDHPDSFSGTIRVDVTRAGGGPGVLLGGITPVLTIDSASDGGVAPIPEPSTCALTLACLGAIGLWAQRTRRASASKYAGTCCRSLWPAPAISTRSARGATRNRRSLCCGSITVSCSP